MRAIVFVAGFWLLLTGRSGAGALLCVAALLMSCAASHGGASCEDAAQRMQELSCLEGYAQPFAPVCAELDPECVVEAESCTDVRTWCRR